MKKLPKGFTLIELMVVVTVIGILSLIGVSIYSAAQRNARDARRRVDLDTVAASLETSKDLYSKDGTYHYDSAVYANDFGSNLPKDPSNPNGTNQYSCATAVGPNKTPTTNWNPQGGGADTICNRSNSGCPSSDPCWYGFLKQNGTLNWDPFNPTTGWTMCTYQEGSANAYCKSSAR